MTIIVDSSSPIDELRQALDESILGEKYKDKVKLEASSGEVECNLSTAYTLEEKAARRAIFNGRWSLKPTIGEATELTVAGLSWRQGLSSDEIIRQLKGSESPACLSTAMAFYDPGLDSFITVRRNMTGTVKETHLEESRSGSIDLDGLFFPDSSSNSLRWHKESTSGDRLYHLTIIGYPRLITFSQILSLATRKVGFVHS